MGQLNSTNNKLTITCINNIASDLILNLNKSDMISLKDIEYCNKLATVISTLIHDNITNNDINDLYYKIYNNLNDYIDDPIEMSEYIAKYYIKIAHIFSIIIIAIYPSYNHNDSNLSYFYLTKHNILTNNINNKISSKEKEVFKVFNVINIEPLYFSDFNMTELQLLYNNCDMSNNDYLLNAYNVDLEMFYKKFTGNDILPNTITKFSDILLKHYDKNATSINNHYELIEKYAYHIAYYIKSMHQYQHKLINILKIIFSSTNNCIDTDFDNDKLNDIIHKLRTIMINMHADSDKNYNISYNILNAFIKEQTIKQDMEIIKSLEY